MLVALHWRHCVCSVHDAQATEMPTQAQRLIHAVRTRNHERLRQLIGKRGDASARSAAGRTALHAAAEEGDIEAARILIESGVEVNARTFTGETPLHLAAAYGGAIDLLDPDADRRDPCGRTRHRPIKPGAAGILTEIIKEKVPDIQSDLGPEDTIPEENKAAVFLAGFECFADPLELYREITARGVDLDRIDPDLAEHLRGDPRFLRVAEFLLEHGADIHASTNSGISVLEGAVERGKPEMVELLLIRGAYPNRQNSADGTSKSLIEIALEGSRICVADMLLNHGADFDPNSSGQLHMAAANGRLDTVLWLLDHGADINRRDHRGNTPLLDAAISGHADVIASLLACGADFRARNDAGNGVLHATSGWQPCLAHLLPLGLPIAEANGEGQTPLHIAAASADPVAIESFLAAGAPASAQDRDGNTPLHAIFFGDEFRPDVEFPTFLALVAGGAKRSVKNGEGKTAFDLATQWNYPEEYLRLLDPAVCIDPALFLWLGHEPYAGFLPKAKVPFGLDGSVWPSSEHYFHAQKTDDPQIRERIREAPDGGAAVCRLRESKAEAPPSWPGRCDGVMRGALLAKFRQNESLRHQLLATGDATLISDSHCDWYWIEREGAGFNAIGKMLMDIRTELRGESAVRE